MKKIITLFWLIAVTTTLQAQKAQMLFYGVVEEGVLTDPNSDDDLSNKKQKNRPLSHVTVHVYAGGELLSSSESKESGFYGVLLKSGGNYEVVFEKNGYFSKTYSMNCRNLLHPADGSALKCPLDVDLFKAVDNAELKKISERPYGVCSVSRNDIQWNKETMMKNRVEFFEVAQPIYLQNTK